LYERLAQKRQQKHVDKGQDSEIKKLRDEVEELSKSRKEEPPQRRRDELEDSLDRSGPLIRREFDENYSRLGRQYAIGDSMF